MAKIKDLEVDTIHINYHAANGFAESTTSAYVPNDAGGPIMVGAVIVGKGTSGLGGTIIWNVYRARDSKIIVGGSVTCNNAPGFANVTDSSQRADATAQDEETYNLGTTVGSNVTIVSKKVLAIWVKR